MEKEETNMKVKMMKCDLEGWAQYWWALLGGLKTEFEMKVWTTKMIESMRMIRTRWALLQGLKQRLKVIVRKYE